MGKLGLSLSQKLNWFRFNRNLTQEELAERIGISRASANRWEKKGAGTASLDEVEKFAEKMGISVAELLGFDIKTEAAERLTFLRNQIDSLIRYIQKETDNNDDHHLTAAEHVPEFKKKK